MAAAPQLIGRTIAGRFRITGFIGEGAMAAVYQGEQDGDPPEVAVKIMHPELLGDDTFAGRFRREARAAARLDHPNTVRIVAYGVDGRLPYIVMERLRGRDLFEILARQHRLPEARAARIVIGVCEALEAAHEHGIVHRDLKPENIMIVGAPGDPSAPRVKVLDFGIAKVLHADAPPPAGPGDAPPSSVAGTTLTRAGMAVGTPAYMSPEQCRGDAIDGRSDIYACGILLFLLVTGRLPFQATGAPWEVAMEHLRRLPPAPSTFVPQLHPGLEATILTALAKWPAQRQQSARELREEIEEILPELPEELHAGAPAGPPPDADTLPISLRGRLAVRSAVEEHAEDAPLTPRAEPTAHAATPPARKYDERADTDPVPTAPLRLLRPSDLDDAPGVDSSEPSLKTQIHPREMAERAFRRDDEPATPPAPPPDHPAPAPEVAAAPRPAAHQPRLAPTVRPPPPRYPSESLAARLIVPIALLVGAAIGLLAFLLMTR